MADESTLRDILTCLGRIEARTSSIENMQSKVVVALIGIIAAVIGVQFTPHSPIPWEEGIRYASRFLVLFTFTFLVGRLIQFRVTHQISRAFITGLSIMALSFSLVMIIQYTPLILIISLRLLYCSCLIWYAWRLCIYPEQKNW